MNKTNPPQEYDVFLSDVHIGIDASTNLYRTSAHQAGLKAILKHIQDAKNIRNVVILGDWVDLWMYKTSAAPDAKANLSKDRERLLPTVEQIFRANPLVFTEQKDGSGDFVSCIKAIRGDLHYVNGNHDISVTAKQINGFLPPEFSKPIIHHDHSYRNDKVYAEHGHFYSMACRPTGKASIPLPIGYFMTRAGADKGMKQPTDMVKELLKLKLKGYSFAKSILLAIASQPPQDTPPLQSFRFHMPDGKTLTSEEVEKMFPDVPGFDLESFLETDVAMGNKDFLRRKVNGKGEPECTVALMGHTHVECDWPLDKPREDYFNTGFLCGSGDVPSTFVKVSVVAPQATMYEVVQDAKKHWIVRPKT